MAEIAISYRYLFIFERIFIALHYFFPHEAMSLSFLFLFACTTLLFYINFQRRIKSSNANLDYKDMIMKKMNQFVAILSTKPSPFDNQSTEEIRSELTVGNRSNGASARRLRRKSKKKNIAEVVEASSEDPSPCNKGEDHPLERKIGEDTSNEDTKRTTSETGTVGSSTTGPDQLLIASSSQFLEEERIKWEREREELQTKLDSTSTILRQACQSQQQIHAQYLEEKRNWEMEKRELTRKLEDSAVNSRLLAFYKGKCLSLQLKGRRAASDQSWSKENTVLNSQTDRFTIWKLHCKAMEDYLIDLDELEKEKLMADAALEMANIVAAHSRQRIMELERHCRLCADPYDGCDRESEYYPTHEYWWDSLGI